MVFPFQVIEHVIEGQHIREYPRATSTPNTPPKLCIKQYTPVTNPDPQPGDVTIIAAQGTGYPKELYEPLWEDLLAQTEKIGLRIRAIWMADGFNQAASGILNEQVLGNDPSWYDYSRDMVHMINCFWDQMPQPIIGIGHSLGAAQLVFACLFHPRLFTSLAFLEPYIGTGHHQDIKLLLRMSTSKRDTWPSRAVAIEKARKIFKRWDPRVFQKWVEYGYRNLSTTSDLAHEQNAKDAPPPVTLATTKHQETLMYGRLNQNNQVQHGLNNRDAYRGQGQPDTTQDGLPVVDLIGPEWHMSCRIEAWLSAQMVVHLRPSVLYLSGSHSDHCRNGIHKELAEKTGTSFCGSGGMPQNRVRHVVIEKGNHSLPQEKVGAIAEVMAPWIQQEVQRWQQSEHRIASGWAGQSQSDKSTLPPEWTLAVNMNKERPSKL